MAIPFVSRKSDLSRLNLMKDWYRIPQDCSYHIYKYNTHVKKAIKTIKISITLSKISFSEFVLLKKVPSYVEWFFCFDCDSQFGFIRIIYLRRLRLPLSLLFFWYLILLWRDFLLKMFFSCRSVDSVWWVKYKSLLISLNLRKIDKK